MTTFKKYPKIHRLGKEETDGVLSGKCYIQEKLDGANTSIWIDKRGEITCASRNRELSEGFNGFVDYVKENENIKNLLSQYPNLRLYGEWLVRHTINYSEAAYKQFYLFDITETKDGEEKEEFWHIDKVYEMARTFDIPTPQLFDTIIDPTVDQIKEYAGKTNLGEVGEGVVIKNFEFVNMFGDTQYAKIVTEKFKEDNGITFGGNNKYSDTYNEMYVINKYMTVERIRKIMNKIQPEIDERLDLKHIPRITKTAYHDLLTEEIWEISEKVESLNFRKLKRLANKKAVQVYKDILLDSISVADKHE